MRWYAKLIYARKKRVNKVRHNNLSGADVDASETSEANDVSINLRVGVPFFPLPYTIFVVLPFHCHQEMEVVVQCTWNYMGKTRPVLDCFLVRLVHRPQKRNISRTSIVSKTFNT